MARARHSRRTVTTLVALVLISVTVISLDESGRAHGLLSGARSLASDVFSPIRNGVNSVLDPVGDFLAGAVHYGSLQQQNQKLDAELGALRQQAAETPFEERQLRELDQLLALERLPALTSIPSVAAETETVNPSNFAATIVIDKGRAQGVTLGDPVVGAGGLVGQVVQANHATSTVRLVTDGDSQVGVTFGNQLYATVEGQAPGKPMVADFIDSNTKIEVHERMFTDGLQGAEYPPGIPVAYVTTVHTVAGADQKDVLVEPMADLQTLTYVAVLQWSPTP